MPYGLWKNVLLLLKCKLPNEIIVYFFSLAKIEFEHFSQIMQQRAGHWIGRSCKVALRVATVDILENVFFSQLVACLQLSKALHLLWSPKRSFILFHPSLFCSSSFLTCTCLWDNCTLNSTIQCNQNLFGFSDQWPHHPSIHPFTQARRPEAIIPLLHSRSHSNQYI